MKSYQSNKIQSSHNDSFLTDDDCSYSTQYAEYIDLREKKFFSFGSSFIAVVYMANTMVIPNMNQLYTELDFKNITDIPLSMIAYWMLMALIIIPCYLVIKLCRDSVNPIFAHLIKEDSNFLYKAFIYSNLTINSVGLFNIAFRIVYNIPTISPYLKQTYDSAFDYDSGSLFYIVIAIQTAVVLVVFGLLYKISYFERFHEVQYRLLLTFAGKWIISFTIFLYLLNIQDISQCSDNKYIDSENLINSTSFDFFGICNYTFNILCCISYPFFEVFYLKRETRSGYDKVKNCYWYQMLLRQMFFFYQVVVWQINYDKLPCYYQPFMQALNLILILLVAISLGPIYAHNYTLNKEILNDKIFSATQQDNKEQVKEIFKIATLIYFIIYTLMILAKFMGNKVYQHVQDHLLEVTSSLHTICFSFCCLAMPIYLYLKSKKLTWMSYLAYAQLLIFVLGFAMISTVPLIH